MLISLLPALSNKSGKNSKYFPMINASSQAVDGIFQQVRKILEKIRDRPLSSSLGALDVTLLDPECILSDPVSSSPPWPEGQCLFLKAWSPVGYPFPTSFPREDDPKATRLLFPKELPFREQPPGGPGSAPPRGCGALSACGGYFGAAAAAAGTPRSLARALTGPGAPLRKSQESLLPRAHLLPLAPAAADLA